MVSRIEIFCPGCGAPEVPELIIREYYNCPTCETVTPREKLDRQRRNNYLLAGTGPGGFGVTLLGTFFDTSASGTVASPFSVSVGSGQLLIACIGTSLLDDVASVTFGASDVMTTDVETVQNTDPYVNICHILGPSPTAGAQTVRIAFSGTPPAEVCMAILRITGHAASPIDRTKTASGASSAFGSGNTLAQTSAGDLAIGAVCYDQDGSPTESFSGGFTFDQGVTGTTLRLAQARRQLSGKAAISCNGTESEAISNSTAVVTIKPL